jgi:hypothetical protein
MAGLLRGARAGLLVGRKAKRKELREMSRNLKAFGLALVSMLCMSAIGASASHALFTAPEGPVDLTGNQATQNIFTTGGGEVKCNVAEFTGTNTEAEAAEQLIEPHYSGCTAFGFTAHVNATPCNYLFTTPKVDLGGGEFTGEPPHVVCPGGGAITITPTFFGFSVCTATIGEQTPTGGHVIYKREGSGATRDLLVTSTVTGIHYTSTGGACGTGGGATNTDGVYTGSVTLKGYKHNQPHTAANHRAVDVDDA